MIDREMVWFDVICWVWVVCMLTMTITHLVTLD